MDADGLIAALGYGDAPGFLGRDRWSEAIEHAHVLRHTERACAKVGGRFRGVYMLGLGRERERSASTPVVYVCEAHDEQQAEAVHRLAWNQSAAPFVLVHMPTGVRLYSGFDYEPGDGDIVPESQRGVLEACVAFEDVVTKLAAFRAACVDDGTLWAIWGPLVNPTRRVDVQLLKNLAALAQSLHAENGLELPVAHALIGRFVYFRYLRERGLLTDKRIESWELDPAEVFGRSMGLKSFHALGDRVDGWLNGAIFPVSKTSDGAPRAAHVRRVAAVMLGDDASSGQGHLPFRAYDFSHIPIELLSSIYEQFIAGEGRDAEAGAYYTPIPLVNFVLGELDDMHPLREGMRVCDPSCGSGAFLVQCYQLMVERCRPSDGELSPVELRRLLVDHIFGLDREEGACRVTEFSLSLALLDQIPTETLNQAHNFKLPSLHDRNIVQADFFSDEAWQGVEGFDWIVGNPPWVKASKGVDDHGRALAWMKTHQKTEPVCGNQIAQAFAWKALDHLRSGTGGVVAFVMPAMTLFETQEAFRREFFTRVSVFAVANLANLREILFGGRARLPAAVFFYGPRTEPPTADTVVYSPMVLNQEANRPEADGHRQPIWTIAVNHGEVKTLRPEVVAAGAALPWKTSMWGSHRDLQLLRSVERRFPNLETFGEGRWHISQGVELYSLEKPSKGFEHQADLVGRQRLSLRPLNKKNHVHSLPSSARPALSHGESWLRVRGGRSGLDVSAPPHVIVSAARTFAVYSDEFIVVPPIQIGVAGPREDSDLLRALALYLGSSFVRYHQFLLSSHTGVREGRATFSAFQQLPIPFAKSDAITLAPWVELHRNLVSLSDRRWALLERTDALQPQHELDDLQRKMSRLEREVDVLTVRALGLSPHEAWLVDDLVHVRMALVDGQIGEAAARVPTEPELREYALALRGVLDEYLDRGERFRHAVTVVHEARAGMIEIAFKDSPTPHEPLVESADTAVGRAMRAVREEIDARRRQWLYFDRNLTIYLNERVYVCKPMQRVWWTRSQALVDADRIIADLVAAGGLA